MDTAKCDRITNEIRNAYSAALRPNGHTIPNGAAYDSLRTRVRRRAEIAALAVAHNAIGLSDDVTDEEILAIARGETDAHTVLEAAAAPYTAILDTSTGAQLDRFAALMGVDRHQVDALAEPARENFDVMSSLSDAADAFVIDDPDAPKE